MSCWSLPLADSLAGRLEVLRLHPLSEAELQGGSGDFLEALFRSELGGSQGHRSGHAQLAERIAAGGYPRALARSSERRRAAWYRDYVDSLVQRDVRDLARISRLDALPRLLAVAASQTARLINVTDLAAPFQLSRPTIRDYVTLLEGVFLLDEIPPWHSNRLSRLVKTPKLHMGDTGLACALLGIDAEGLTAEPGLYGQMLETFVLQELRRQASWSEQPISFYHFRDKDGVEVDVVLERGGRGEVAGVGVKASSTVREGDFRGLRKLKEGAGRRFVTGVILYDGETTASFGEGLYAVPLSRLWEATSGARTALPLPGPLPTLPVPIRGAAGFAEVSFSTHDPGSGTDQRSASPSGETCVIAAARSATSWLLTPA